MSHIEENVNFAVEQGNETVQRYRQPAAEGACHKLEIESQLMNMINNR